MSGGLHEVCFSPSPFGFCFGTKGLRTGLDNLARVQIYNLNITINSYRLDAALGVQLQRLPGVSLVEAVLDVRGDVLLPPGVRDPGVPELDHLLTESGSGRQQTCSARKPNVSK